MQSAGLRSAATAAELSLVYACQSSRAMRQAHSKSGVNVVLEQVVDKLGTVGEQVTTSRGYARNFLVPRSLARQLPKLRSKIPEPGEKLAKGPRKRAGSSDGSSVQQLQRVLEVLGTSSVEVERRRVSRASGAKLMRPVTAGCIARAVLEQRKIALSPQLLAMEGPLETAGPHQVALRLVAGGGTRPSLAVMVTDRRQPALRESAIRATPLSHADESTQAAV